VNSPASTKNSAAEFVEFFAAGWAIGACDPEGFYQHFEQRMHQNAALIQPIAGPSRGPGALRELFGPLFLAVPDLTGTLRRWGESADGVFIELTLHGHLGRKAIEWTVVDRIILEDGKIRERRSYFDSVPLLRALALRPRASLPLLFDLFGRRNH
jgi:ketosteroid isomerase-like protein